VAKRRMVVLKKTDMGRNEGRGSKEVTRRRHRGISAQNTNKKTTGNREEKNYLMMERAEKRGGHTVLKKSLNKKRERY